MACSIEQIPCAVSKDERALHDYAKELHDSYSSMFVGYGILEVPEIEPKQEEVSGEKVYECKHCGLIDCGGFTDKCPVCGWKVKR